MQGHGTPLYQLSGQFDVDRAQFATDAAHRVMLTDGVDTVLDLTEGPPSAVVRSTMPTR